MVSAAIQSPSMKRMKLPARPRRNRMDCEEWRPKQGETDDVLVDEDDDCELKKETQK